jgi:DNA invertase Pin-like site-specific DNA recombinase
VVLTAFTEVETGKGANALERRPQLCLALAECKRQKAVLVIAKLDRLSRSVHFVSGLMESRVRFVACDLPEANELTIHVMAAFAEHEAKRISQRTKDALAVAKARGVVLGRAGRENLQPGLENRREAAEKFAARLAGQIEGMRLRGLSQRRMVDELNTLRISSPKGGSWRLSQLQRVLARVDAQRV